MGSDRHWSDIGEVREEALVCCRCDLCYGRTHVVFGEGPVPSGMMIVGEGPGADEDAQGKPFVGRAGTILDQVLESAGISRGDVWVTNTVRCRPTSIEGDRLRNRAPRADEIRACNLWMEHELKFVSPAVIVCLGAVPAQTLISSQIRIGMARGRWHEGRYGIPTTVTYHPAYVLRLRGEDRRVVLATMVDDLRMAAGKLAQSDKAA